MNQLITKRMEEHREVLDRLLASDLPEKLGQAADLVEKALAAGHKVLFCGNGGSAADSQHLAAEFVGRSRRNGAVCLPSP